MFARSGLIFFSNINTHLVICAGELIFLYGKSGGKKWSQVIEFVYNFLLEKMKLINLSNVLPHEYDFAQQIVNKVRANTPTITNK